MQGDKRKKNGRKFGDSGKLRKKRRIKTMDGMSEAGGRVDSNVLEDKKAEKKRKVQSKGGNLGKVGDI